MQLSALRMPRGNDGKSKQCNTEQIIEGGSENTIEKKRIVYIRHLMGKVTES